MADTQTAAKATPKSKKKSSGGEGIVAFSLEPQVRARMVQLAKAEGHELGHYLQKLVENHLLEKAADGDELAERIKSKRAVIDHVVTLAQKLDADGKFDEAFVLTVMQTAAKDKGFMTLYNTAIAEGSKHSGRRQRLLNQQLGRLIRKAVGAVGKRNDDKKVMRGQATGEIISSYTLLAKDA